MPKKDLGCTRLLWHDTSKNHWYHYLLVFEFPILFTCIEEKRSVSPYRFPLLRTGSRSSRPTTPKTSRSSTPNPTRPITPNPSNAARQRVSDINQCMLLNTLAMSSVVYLTGLYLCSYQYPSEPRKSASMRLSAERDNGKEVEQYPSKSKGLLKALLSRRKSKKDDTLYTYLDEYWYHRIYRKNGKCGVKSWKQVMFCFLVLPILFNRLHFTISSVYCTFYFAVLYYSKIPKLSCVTVQELL